MTILKCKTIIHQLGHSQSTNYIESRVFERSLILLDTRSLDQTVAQQNHECLVQF